MIKCCGAVGQIPVDTADRKRACAVSMQWLRGRRADIGAEFSLMADTLGRMETLAGAGESTLDALAHRSG